MGSMDELRSPSRPTSPAAPIIVCPSPSMLSVLQLLGTIRCPEKPRAAQEDLGTGLSPSLSTSARGLLGCPIPVVVNCDPQRLDTRPGSTGNCAMPLA